MKILMTGGGTGGHIYPAIAIADKFKERIWMQRYFSLARSMDWKRNWCQEADMRYAL